MRWGTCRGDLPQDRRFFPGRCPEPAWCRETQPVPAPTTVRWPAPNPMLQRPPRRRGPDEPGGLSVEEAAGRRPDSSLPVSGPQGGAARQRQCPTLPLRDLSPQSAACWIAGQPAVCSAAKGKSRLSGHVQNSRKRLSMTLCKHSLLEDLIIQFSFPGITPAPLHVVRACYSIFTHLESLSCTQVSKAGI